MRAPNDDFDEEIRNHIDMLTERLIRQGMAADEARHAARRQFGNATALKEVRTEMSRWHWLERLAQDLRYGFRTLRNNPGFSLVAILTAALGIGANTSIFSVVNAVLMRPLPYRDAGRLVSLISASRNEIVGPLVPDFQYASWRDETKIFDAVCAFGGRRFTITRDGEPERLKARTVTPGFLRMLGVNPVLGRDFVASDAAPRGGNVVLLSYPLWVRRFARDPSILSRRITLDGKPCSVAGVLPKDFEFPDNTDVSLLTAMTEPSSQPAGVTWFYFVLARLKPDVTLQRAESDLAVVDHRLKSAYPNKFAGPRGDVQSRAIGLHDKLVGDVRPALLVLSGAVGLVLLIACVNIGNLLLARAIVRQKEIAVRIALGAGRRRVFHQLLTESMLLAAAGGVAGLGLSYAGVKVLLAIAPAGVPHIESAHISVAALLFNVAIAAGSGVLFGIVPMRRAANVVPGNALKQIARSATGDRTHRRLEDLLVVSEVAFALILVAGAGLLIRTFGGLTSIATGFRPDNVIAAPLSLPNWKYPTAAKNRAFFDALLARVRSGPGVDSAGAVGGLPYEGFAMSDALEIEGRPAPRPEDNSEANSTAIDYATDDYFSAIGIPVLSGRPLGPMDNATGEKVGVVNQAFVRHFLSGEPVVGKRVRTSVTGWLRIVGVVGNVKQFGLVSETRPEIFQSAAQSDSGVNAQTLVVRSHADERVLIPWLRAQIAALDKDLPPPEIQTMQERMASLVASQKFVMRLLALFAGIAIALAAIGIYGVLVYSVEQRTREIGIRVALGAKRGEVMGLILGRGLRLSTAGVVIGVGGALLTTRYLKSLLYGVTPHDPVTLGFGCALLIAIAAGAAWLPARRALSVDPMAALRNE